MVAQDSQQYVNLIERFSLLEKILMRIGFYGFIIIGAYGIYSVSITGGLIYTCFAIFGFIFVVLYCLCAHCPYPYKYSTCLFLPSGLVKKLYKFRSERMSISDKIGWIIMMAGLVMIPQYWLLENHVVLTIFWILCLPTLVSISFYYCRRCRHFDCPFNSVRMKSESKDQGEG